MDLAGLNTALAISLWKALATGRGSEVHPAFRLTAVAFRPPLCPRINTLSCCGELGQEEGKAQQICGPAGAEMTRDQRIIKRGHLLQATAREDAAFVEEFPGVGSNVIQAGETAARYKIGVVVDREQMQQ